MRDIHKDKKYFSDYISRHYSAQEILIKKLKSNLVKLERIAPVKMQLTKDYLNIIFAKYSRGDDMFNKEVYSIFENTVNLMTENWSERHQNILYYLEKNKVIYLKQYTLSYHVFMLNMLSIGYLLNVDDLQFQLINDFIEKDEIKDFIYDFLLRSKLQDKAPITDSNFKVFSGFKDPFVTIKQIINTSNNEEAEVLLKMFLESEWLNLINKHNLYSPHTNKFNVYYGYWCFPAAAIVKIKGLDDSSFRDNPYYPKDLIQ
ncbi:PoNe immunity protein domain-containing protein [Olleya sp. 1-3]|uniref:PoNe immunity protein domain-containing protein n=1 Tax=Olleya sp. 1-3 TaxID=2058323 RepID=UPI0018E38AD9|nr:PoNe immunity protein domain-containing protein [Olleya sp. 1-3]